MPDTPKGPDHFVTAAYSLTDKQSLLSFYRKWAVEYDEKMRVQGYISPRDIAGLLADHLENRDARILDLGCGTGLVGKEMIDHGFSRLDGIDVSGEMIAVARARDLYGHLMIGDLNHPLPLPDSSYDAAISSGTFTHGHVGPEPIPEIFRILKPGGFLACTIHFDLWHRRGFDAMFAQLMSAKAIECVTLSEGPYYTAGRPEGWFCLYRKSRTAGPAE